VIPGPCKFVTYFLLLGLEGASSGGGLWGGRTAGSSGGGGGVRNEGVGVRSKQPDFWML
jgi:hypothetical protein